MIELGQTETFRKWRTELKDQRARALIASRLDRLAFGHAGDVQPGPGYRVYFQRRGDVIVILLCGGDKSTRAKDIRTAKLLAAEWEEWNG
ncbi:type II toxin-antitoxin system RelE/ParE family toxin [Phyllobacterium bourgognense]|uniref:type II toxin-antitoxin system RelE/ParE family toxin n=1 Tax=Phyllobacterium bourgognense TaxID=314236 RepID=UPI000DF4A5BF|nr:type II toxin-antitoxin system RelE/ParE family toxin [Phyllobacterium bourgognense]